MENTPMFAYRFQQTVSKSWKTVHNWLAFWQGLWINICCSSSRADLVQTCNGQFEMFVNQPTSDNNLQSSYPEHLNFRKLFVFCNCLWWKWAYFIIIIKLLIFSLMTLQSWQMKYRFCNSNAVLESQFATSHQTHSKQLVPQTVMQLLLGDSCCLEWDEVRISLRRNEMLLCRKSDQLKECPGPAFPGLSKSASTRLQCEKHLSLSSLWLLLGERLETKMGAWLKRKKRIFQASFTRWISKYVLEWFRFKI